tara:strand:- start:3 stop:134 length:132 start_codon:yes stop_codon:yes gene_type:complete
MTKKGQFTWGLLKAIWGDQFGHSKINLNLNVSTFVIFQKIYSN